MHVSKCLVGIAYFLLFLTPLALLPAMDPGLIKWPLVAASASLAILTFVRPRSVHWVDALAGSLVLYALIYSGNYHDQWAVDLATCIMGLFYIFGRWNTQPLPRWLILGFIWIVCARGFLDLFLGSIWAMGVPFAMPSFFVHKNIFGYLLTPLIWYAWAQFTVAKFTWQRWAWIATAFLTYVALVSSNSRGAFLGFLASIPVVAVAISLRDRKLKPLGTYAIALFLAVVLSVVIMPTIAGNLSEIGRGIQEKKVELPRNFHTKSSSEWRAWIWRATIESWKESPIFGNGSGTTQYRIIQFQETTYDDVRNPYQSAWRAHSHYLEMLNERGVFGLFIELCLLGIALWGFFRSKGLAIYGTGALTALAVHNGVAEASEYPSSIALYWGLIGGGVALWTCDSKFRLQHRLLNLFIVSALPVIALMFGFFSIRPISADYLSLKALKEPNQTLKFDYYAQALNLWPRNPEALLVLAVNQSENGNHQDAISTLDRLDSGAPGLKYTPILRAQIHYHAKKFHESEKYGRIGFADYPYDVSIQKVLMASLHKQGKCQALDSIKAEVSFQINNLFLPQNKATQIDLVKRKTDYAHLPIPSWAPKSAIQGYLKLNTPELGAAKNALYGRLAALDSMRCP